MPPDQRTNYRCEREATGPLNRKQLIEHINKIAIETPDQPEAVPYVPGTVRGKKVIDTFRSVEIDTRLIFLMDELATLIWPWLKCVGFFGDDRF